MARIHSVEVSMSGPTKCIGCEVIVHLQINYHKVYLPVEINQIYLGVSNVRLSRTVV